MLYMNYPRWGDCAFSESFISECTYVRSFAREGVELTVHKESVVVEEIKEVELRSRSAQFFFMTEILIELGYNHRVMHLEDFQ